MQIPIRLATLLLAAFAVLGLMAVGDGSGSEALASPPADLAQGDADCSGALGVDDVLADLHAAADPEAVTECTGAAGDVDCDGDLDANDALSLITSLADLTVTAPDWCPPIGEALTNPPTSGELIAAGLQAGDIDYETSLLYRAYSLTGDARLPETYRSEVMDMGEWNDLFREVDQNEGTLSQDLLDQLVAWRVRPADPRSIFNNPPQVQAAADPEPEPHWGSVLAAGGKVRIWAPDNYLTQQELDLAAATVDLVWTLMPGLIGLPKEDEPDDSGINPDTAFDIYINEPWGYDPRVGCREDPVPCFPRWAGGPGFAFGRTTAKFEGRTAAGYGTILTRPNDQWFPMDVVRVVAYGAEFKYDAYEDPWLANTTVHWAEYRVSRFLQTDSGYFGWTFSHQALYPEKTLTRDISEETAPGTWSYLELASRKQGDGVVKAAWQNAAADGTQGPKALDDAILFREAFPEFAVWNWNQQPPLVHMYKDHDENFSRSHAIPEVHYMPTPVKTTLAGSYAPLTSSYEQFTFGKPVRTVAIDVDQQPPGLHTWALVKIGSEWKEPEDWTDIGHKEYCRDDPNENLTQLVLIISNSNMTDSASLTGGPKVEGKSLGCNGWAGTMTGDRTWDADNSSGHATTTFKGRWNLLSDEDTPPCPWVLSTCPTYLPVGTVSWTWHSENSLDHCNETKSGSQAYAPVMTDGQGELRLFLAEADGPHRYHGEGLWRLNPQNACADLVNLGTRQPPEFFFLSDIARSTNQPGGAGNNCSLKDWFVNEDAGTISGSCVEEDYDKSAGEHTTLTYTWDLHEVGNATGQ